MMTFRTTCRSIFSAAALITAGSTAQAQNGVTCDGIDYDVNEVARLAVDQPWLNNTYLPLVRERINFDASSGWAGTGGIDTFDSDRGSPFHKFVLGTMLAAGGISGSKVPVKQSSDGLWGYDDAAFFIGSNHNVSGEYWRLARSDSIQACTEVNKNDGKALCVDSEPNGWSLWARAYFANVYFGDQETVKMESLIDGSSTVFANYSSKSVPVLDDTGFYAANPVRYGCPTFNSPRGVALTSVTMVHENFHGPSDALHCGSGGTCADAWIFDMPTSPRTYNQLPANRRVDSYQVEQRFMCDVVEEPADWVPLMVQAVVNAEHNDMADKNIFQNVTAPDPSGVGTVITGNAPLSCGLPESRLGSVVVTCNAADSCSVASDCATGDSCNDGCCVPATCGTSGGTNCSSASDCSSIETCDANSCCVPLACPDPGGLSVCETSTDCGDFQQCIDSCCYYIAT